MDFLGLISLIFYSLLSLLMLAICFYCAYLIYIHAKYDHLPGPKRSSFLLGNLKELMDGVLDPTEDAAEPKNRSLIPQFERHIEWAEKYGSTYVVFVLHKVVIITHSPEAVKLLLISGDPKIYRRPTDVLSLRFVLGERFVGHGLASIVEQEPWYHRRKVLDKLFQHKQLPKLVETLNTSADVLMKQLEVHADRNETIYLLDILHRTAADVILRGLFSIDSDNLNTRFHDLGVDFPQKSFEGFQKGNLSMLPLTLQKLIHHKFCKKLHKTVEDTRNAARDIIEERQKKIENSEQVPNDAITVMIQNKDEPGVAYTMDTMIDEFCTMIVGGTESTGNAMSFLIMELCRRPDLLKRMTSEIEEVVGSRQHVTYDDIGKLTFTNQLMKEILRRYSPAPALLKHVSQESTWDGLRIPGNTDCIVLLAAAMRNSEVWNEPVTINPDRFSGEANKKVTIYNYIPFGTGPHNCIGQSLAQLEMKVILVKFYQLFRFELDSSETFGIGQRGNVYPACKLKGVVVKLKG